jgi:hypothetical protein
VYYIILLKISFFLSDITKVHIIDRIHKEVI